MSEKTVLVPVADGSEELEAVSIIDVLRRAGAAVTVASVGPELEVKCSRGTVLVADKPLEACKDKTFDLIALPGGMPGAEHLAASAVLKKLLLDQRAAGRYYAAICASPAVVLQAHGLLEGERATCHPSFFEKLAADKRSEDRVVVSGKCATSRGAGTGVEFAMKLVELLYGEEKARETAGPMLFKDPG